MYRVVPPFRPQPALEWRGEGTVRAVFLDTAIVLQPLDARANVVQSKREGTILQFFSGTQVRDADAGFRHGQITALQSFTD